MVSVCLLDHTADCSIGSRYRRISLTNKHTFWTQSFFCNIIRPFCSLLNINSNNLFPIFIQCFIMQEHCKIRFDSIPNHVANLQGSSIRVLYANYGSIILNPDIQFSTFTICKCNYFLLYVIHYNRLQFHSFAFLKNHLIASCKYSTHILTILTILVNHWLE